MHVYVVPMIMSNLMHHVLELSGSMHHILWEPLYKQEPALGIPAHSGHDWAFSAGAVSVLAAWQAWGHRGTGCSAPLDGTAARRTRPRPELFHHLAALEPAGTS